MAKPRLIAIDIDGTLIDSQTRLRGDVERAIRRAMDDGAIVTLSTGRMISAARQYIDILKIDVPIIALNGAIVADGRNGGEPIYHEPISLESSKTIIEKAWESDTTLIFVRCDMAYARNITDLTGPALATWIVNITDFSDKEIIERFQPTAILIAGESETVGELYSNMTELVDIEHFMFPSIRYFPIHYIEYRARGTNKGRGLAMLRKSLGIPRESVLSIGDYLNDIPMAEESGIFAVPANALEEVRAVADYISPSSNDEGAVAEILEELYFNAK